MNDRSEIDLGDGVCECVSELLWDAEVEMGD